jgi:chaperonin GroES
VVLTLLDDQVLIRRAPAETVTTGGLVLPDRDVPIPLRGTVLAVGPGKAPTCPCGVRVPVAVQPGDEVLHARYAGTDVEVDGAPCLVVREADVLGVLTP